MKNEAVPRHSGTNGTPVSYTHLDVYKRQHYWCDDPSSRYYNQLVDTRTATDFKASQGEHLKSVSPEYNYGIFSEDNKEGEGRKGSAIFLHCKGNSKTTSGCIAVEQSVMKALLRQLKPGAKIVIY